MKANPLSPSCCLRKISRNERRANNPPLHPPMKKQHMTLHQHEELKKALETLRRVGIQHFDEASRDHINRYTAIGAALAFVEQSPLAAASLACEYWEEHNHHGLAALVRWAMPVLNPAGP